MATIMRKVKIFQVIGKFSLNLHIGRIIFWIKYNVYRKKKFLIIKFLTDECDCVAGGRPENFASPGAPDGLEATFIGRQ